jgi:hypothetical protein
MAFFEEWTASSGRRLPPMIHSAGIGGGMRHPSGRREDRCRVLTIDYYTADPDDDVAGVVHSLRGHLAARPLQE